MVDVSFGDSLTTKPQLKPEDEVVEGPRLSATSLVSSCSEISDILQHNQRLIFKYPDGTYAYAFK